MDAPTKGVIESFRHALHFSLLCIFPLATVYRKTRESRIFPPEISGQDQEVLALNKCPPAIPLAKT